jgi:penicillin-binding protein 2
LRIRHSPLNSRDGELDRFRFRVAFAGGVVVLAFGLLIGRFVWLQVVSTTTTDARRGQPHLAGADRAQPRRHHDRNGVVLARNYSAFTLEITPSRSRNLDATIDGLAERHRDPAQGPRRFRKLLDESKQSFESLPIRTRLTDEEVARFAANRYRFPGVEVKARLFRQYPLGAVAAHALGYINRINRARSRAIEEAEQRPTTRAPTTSARPAWSSSTSSSCTAKPATRRSRSTPAGAPCAACRARRRSPGNNLTLTLDMPKLQEITEKAFGDRRGALVAIEPSTGGILALVSTPTFDPNLFVDGIDAQTGSAQQSPEQADGQPRAQRRLSARLDLQALHGAGRAELGKRTPEQAIADPGFFNFGGHRFRDDKKGGHGMVDMYKSIVVPATPITTCWPTTWASTTSPVHGPLGLGSAPASTSKANRRACCRRRNGRSALQAPEQQKWYAGETISIGIGQGYNAYTPIQLAQATATWPTTA